MPNIQAFRGLRYNLGHVGELEAVLAPAPRFIAADDQNELYKKHPCNFVRLNCNRTEPGDVGGDRLERAVRYFRNWQREGVFERDGEAAIYVIQVEEENGDTSPSMGFISIAGIDSLSSSHQESADRSAIDSELHLIKRCEANLNPVTVLLEDFDAKIELLLTAQVANKAPVQAEANGLKFKLWIENDLHFISSLSALAASVEHMAIANLESLAAAEEYKKSCSDSSNDVVPQSDSVLSCCMCVSGLRLSEILDQAATLDSTNTSPKLIEFADGLIRIPVILSGLVVNVFD